eukprot:sb/3461879/
MVELSEPMKERLMKVTRLGQKVFYYGIIPYIIYKGLQTNPDPATGLPPPSLLRKLEIQSMNLRTLPKEIDHVDTSDVMVVDLSKNKFNEIPEEVLECEAVEELNCYYNMIRSIIDMSSLRFLCKLNLSRNQLTSPNPDPYSLILPGNLTQLMDLDMSCNMLSSIPPEFGKLTNLRDLNARNNFITHIPSELTETPLVRLDLSYNRIAIIPPSYRFLKDLKFLDISNNPLVCPPAQYAERGRVHIFKLLEILVWQQEQKDLLEYEKVFRRKKEEERMKHNFANPRSTLTNSASHVMVELSEPMKERLMKVTRLGQKVFYYGIIPYIIYKGLQTNPDPATGLPPPSLLRKLEIQSMNLRTLPKEIDHVDTSDVMVVDLSKNKFNEIPEEVLECEAVEELNCYYNMIRSIIDMSSLRFLCKLNLSRNQLTSIPSHLCSLPLEELYLANNKIHTLPAEIELTETPLVRLDLSYNRIAIIPPSYRFLKDLKFLDISNNPLVCPPAQYAERGRVHIFKLLEILVWQQEQKDLLEYEKVFRRKKEEERMKHNFANPRSTLTNSASFISDLLVSWDCQATAWMLEDPFFKKELEKDKTYREKYGIGGDYMKRSLQVAQGRSINTINRTTGKALAKQLADTSSDMTLPETSEPIPSPQSEKREKKKKDSKTKSPKSVKYSPKSDKSNEDSEKVKKSPKVSGIPDLVVSPEEAALASLDEVLLDGLSGSRSSTLTSLSSLSSKRSVSFSDNKEVIPPVPTSSPPVSDPEDGEGEESSFTITRNEGKVAQLQVQENFIKNVVAKYLAVSLQEVDALKDGVLLCQLLNVMRKNTIRMVHVPQGGEPLSTLKASRNLGGFISFAQLQFGRESISLPDLQACSVPWTGVREIIKNNKMDGTPVLPVQTEIRE